MKTGSYEKSREPTRSRHIGLEQVVPAQVGMRILSSMLYRVLFQIVRLLVRHSRGAHQLAGCLHSG